MQTGILPHLLGLIGDPLGTLRALARKGLGAIRAFLGSARGLIRPLIKKVVAFVASRIAPAAERARGKVSDALGSLKRRVQEVIKRPAPQQTQTTPTAQEAPAPTVLHEAATPDIADKSSVLAPQAAAGPARAAVTRETPQSVAPSVNVLTTLAPVVRRALALTLGTSPRRTQREGRPRGNQRPRPATPGSLDALERPATRAL